MNSLARSTARFNTLSSCSLRIWPAPPGVVSYRIKRKRPQIANMDEIDYLTLLMESRIIQAYSI